MKDGYWQIEYKRVRFKDSCQLQRKWRAGAYGNIRQFGIDDGGSSMAYIERPDRGGPGPAARVENRRRR